jgi:NADPH:quinone reductase-like Zn-dependent oxidoreductase
MSQVNGDDAEGRAFHLVGSGAGGSLSLTSRPQPRPEPGPGQVAVRVRAASLNRRDLMLIDGTYPVPAAPGVVPLSDGVGEVVALGAGVTRAAVGDRVAATYFRRWIAGPQRRAHAVEQHGASHDGWLATYAVFEQESIVHVPEHLTDAEAACLTCACVVAWAALTTPAPPTPGQTVLTVGSGAVALFAVQFARLFGARVISVTSSPRKAMRLRELGSHETVDRTQEPDWEQAVRRLSEDGVEYVLDAVGMATLPKSVASAAFNAHITLLGAFPSAAPADNPFAAAYLSIRRIAVGSRTDYEAMNRALSAHRLRPAIDREFPFTEAPDAYRHLREGNPLGKVVVIV